MTRLAHSPRTAPRLPTKILRKIFRMTVICPNPLRIDSATQPDRDVSSEDEENAERSSRMHTFPIFTPPTLRLNRSTHNELLHYFYKHNTFSLRRSSLCHFNHSPYKLSIPPSQRFKIRNILLATFAGTPVCHRLALGTLKPSTTDGQPRSCQPCNPTQIPDLSTLFPNAKLIIIDYAANRDSRIVFEHLCKALVTSQGNHYLHTIGVGETVLCTNTSTRTSATTVFSDRRLARIWRTLVTIPPTCLYTRACPEALAMKRLSLRTTEMILRLLDFYDHECDFLVLAADATATRLPSDLRGEQREMSSAFLTAFDWALREYLGTRDSPFVRALEGGGLRGVREGRRLERALLEELGQYPQSLLGLSRDRVLANRADCGDRLDPEVVSGEGQQEYP